MKKVLVTGCTGFIGGALTTRLLSSGVSVVGVDVNATAMQAKYSQYPNFTAVVASFEDYHNLHKLVADRDIDVFYHFAWAGVFGNAFKDYQLQLDNAKYACIAVEQAIAINAKKFVFAGTMNEYEMDSYIGKEYFEPRYTYIYSVAKQCSEAIGKTLAFNSNIAYNTGRIAMAFGENNRSMMLPNVVMKNALNHQPIKLVEGNNLYDMIYIDDIVDAFIAIGEKGVNMKSYYIGHRKIGTFREIVSKMAYAIDSNADLQFGVYPEPPTGVDYNLIDTEALYRDTGFECKADFEQSVIKTAKWLQQSGI